MKIKIIGINGILETNIEDFCNKSKKHSEQLQKDFFNSKYNYRIELCNEPVDNEQTTSEKCDHIGLKYVKTGSDYQTKFTVACADCDWEMVYETNV